MINETNKAMITTNQITEGAQFKTKSGIVWIIDSVSNDVVRTSMSHGKKGNYRDSVNEVVSFLNEENAVAL